MKTALQSLNTVTINVLYIDSVEDKTFSLYGFQGQALAQETLPRGHEI